MSVFTGIAGHEAIRERLAAAINQDTISHAYLFEGIEGVGKHTMAHAFIKALLCTEPQAQHMPCGHCVSCRTLESGNHPDVSWIGREGKNSLGIRQIRERIVADVHTQPYQSAYKVYVIEDADTMTPEAQNALLKTLEEPPSYVVLILLAASSTGFLPTILSRVVTIRFQPLQNDVIVQALEERLKMDPEQGAVTAALSRGSLGYALQLATSKDFAQLRAELSEILTQLPEMRPPQILKLADFFDRYKDKQDTVFSLIKLWYRDLLMYRSTHDLEALITKDAAETIRTVSASYTTEELLRQFSHVQKAEDAIRQGAQYAFTIDWLLSTYI